MTHETVFKLTPELVHALDDATLSRQHKLGLLQKAGITLPVAIQELKATIREKRELQRHHQQKLATLISLEAKEKITASLRAWLLRAETEQRLESNNCSRIHKLIEAQRAGCIIHDVTSSVLAGDSSLDVGDDHRRMSEADELWMGLTENIIVVEHNWGAVMGEEVGADQTFQLPYPVTVFEMRITGRTVIVIACDMEDVPPGFVAFVECDDGFWYAPYERANNWSIFHFARHQLAAISIVLDAEVAMKQPVRAPTALNVKRVKQDKVPLSNFHIVRLNRKTRSVMLPAAANADYTHKRLHFRRGHWRHYETFKTWVRWALVGNPDLGFIDKEYRI